MMQGLSPGSHSRGSGPLALDRNAEHARNPLSPELDRDEMVYVDVAIRSGEMSMWDVTRT